MGNLLFSPNGRIGEALFMKGAVILLAINFFMWLSWYVGLGIGMLAGLLSFALIYCWGCLFAKRFHDAGKTGWNFAFVFIGFLILAYFLGSFLTVMLAPEIVEEMVGFKDTFDPADPDVEAMMAFYSKIFKALAVPYAAAYLLAGTAVSFAVNKMVKSDMDENQYG